MKFTLRGASSAALLLGLAGSFPAWAQDTVSGPQPPAEASDESDRVVVTGSLIAGTPEDAALPVEVFTQADLEEQGAPTALEFVKSLTISGPTTGEAYYFGGAGSTGSPSFNLRGIGADKTLTLLNGRRVSEAASSIPSIAIARTEILKDGAAVTYGADATGGVVNFISRDNFTGLEASAQYKLVDGSDGDYGVAVLGGFGEGETNFIWAAEWEHRSQLDTTARDFTEDSYNFATGNQAPWSTLTNLAGWQARGAVPAYPGANGQPPNSANGEFGSPVSASVFSDFTPASCAAVGGFYVNSFTCNYNYAPYYNLVEEQDTYRVFAQINSAVNDDVNFHTDLSFSEVSVPQVFGSPSQPVVRGPARAAGLQNQFYVPRTNPYFQEFATRSGLAASPAFASVAGVTPITFRPLAHGGNPVLGEGNGFGVPSRIKNQNWRIMSQLDGRVGDWAGIFKDVNFNLSSTFNQQNFEGDASDILGFRFQEALNGFGGPSCNAPDLDPLKFGTQNASAAGRNGCLYWNPFASAFPNQPERNLANPSYVPGSENPVELYRWFSDPRKTEFQIQSLDVDAVFSGQTGIQLPGGEIGWGLGVNWRQVEFFETVRSDFYNGSTPCEQPPGTTTGIDPDGAGPLPAAPFPQIPVPTSSPLFTGCAGGEGPFLFFDINPPDAADRQNLSFFGELALPVFDNLNLQAAVRREDYSGGLGATVYKVSGKWDVFGPLSIRGSYGTNYQTPPIDLIPGQTENLVRSYDRASRNWKAFQRTTLDGVKPETATAWNAGVVLQMDGFGDGHDFQLIVDYFNIETEDEIDELASHNQILNAATLAGTVNGFNLMNCASPFISRISFSQTATAPGGVCTQGLTTSDDFSVIRSLYGNAYGQTTSGIDIQTSYNMPVGPGDLSLNLTATQVLEQTTSARTLDGIQVAAKDDRVGNLNFSTVGVPVPEFRVNAFATYRLDSHTARFAVNYISAVTDERTGVQYGESGEDWITADVNYLFDVTENLRLTFTVANIFDRDPPPAQVELGYDPRAGGNALGRTFELGVKSTF
jgi:iron complex outermembrane receptor protein